ncbi:MAG TPA: sigma-70 family RNA polymerase sigma factor [Actinomycetota bacterium]|nr:sigma-70 family RNA polymerase sigma factor [Actinomycetota bacterium]
MRADDQSTHQTDSEQFTSLFRCHYESLLRFAQRRIGSDGAQEIVAETFLVAWRRLDDVPAEALPWLYRVALYQMANLHRRTLRDERADASTASGEAGKTVDPAEVVSQHDALAGALARLSETEREILRLAAWEGLGPTEGAAVLGCSPSAYKVRLHRARKRLERAFDVEVRQPGDESRLERESNPTPSSLGSASGRSVVADKEVGR